MRQQKTQFRRIFRRMFICAIGLLICGCVSNSYWIWEHPGKLGDAERQQAVSECTYLAQHEVNRYDYYRPYYDVYYYDRYSTYGHHRPYYWRYPYYDFYNYNADLNRFFRVCMRAKGWQQVRVDIQGQNQSFDP